MKNNLNKIFADKADIRHKSKFDYSLVNYKNKKTKVIIKCPEHGEFEQTPDNHLDKRGHGCPTCGKNKSAVFHNDNSENFILKSKQKYGNIFSYDGLKYQNNKIKVIITCKVHGDFEQTPVVHLDKRTGGCPECSKRIGYDKLLKDNEYFIKKAEQIHGKKYNYSLLDYKRNDIKVTIICDKHGEFEQTPYSHLVGHGCSECHQEINCYYNDSYKWKFRADESTNFDSFKFYLVKLTSNNESFYKIGITYRKINSRLNNKIPYNKELLLVIEDKIDYKMIFGLEKETKETIKNNLYLPELKFSGRRECFKMGTKEINKLIKIINIKTKS